MIRLFQANEPDLEDHVRSMHRFRAQLFGDELGWDVIVDSDLCERDEFDRVDTVYCTVSTVDGEIIGCCRLVDCKMPYMIKEKWNYLLLSIENPSLKTSWELSRFGVLSRNLDIMARLKHGQSVATQLFYGVVRFCSIVGINDIYALHSDSVERAARKLGCCPAATSSFMMIGKDRCRVGRYAIDEELFHKLGAQLSADQRQCEFSEHLIWRVCEQIAKAELEV